MADILFPASEPYKKQPLDVGNGQTISVACFGNPKGKPIFCLHGGPGGVTSALDPRAYNPHYWNIITYHQIGCGNSVPHGELKHNTITNNVAALDLLRQAMGAQKAVLSGGSWGTALAMEYAAAHPQNVEAIILRASMFPDPKSASALITPNPEMATNHNEPSGSAYAEYCSD